MSNKSAKRLRREQRSATGCTYIDEKRSAGNLLYEKRQARQKEFDRMKTEHPEEYARYDENRDNQIKEARRTLAVLSRSVAVIAGSLTV